MKEDQEEFILEWILMSRQDHFKTRFQGFQGFKVFKVFIELFAPGG